MERILIKAQLRSGTGKGAARKLRRKELIPAILYGHKRESLPLVINLEELKKVLGDREREHALHALKVEGRDNLGEKLVMIKEIQIDPLGEEYLHVDLYEVKMDEKITVPVMVHIVGKAEGVKIGGILQYIMREIEVRCFPTQIPEHVELDISALGIGDSLHVRDLKVPEGVEILSPPDLPIVSVVAPTVEKEVVVEKEVKEVAPAEAEAATEKKAEEKAPEKEK
jgi:large subunit ribosomal protein L25